MGISTDPRQDAAVGAPPLDAYYFDSLSLGTSTFPTASNTYVPINGGSKPAHRLESAVPAGWALGSDPGNQHYLSVPAGVYSITYTANAAAALIDAGIIAAAANGQLGSAPGARGIAAATDGQATIVIAFDVATKIKFRCQTSGASTGFALIHVVRLGDVDLTITTT